MGWFVRKSVKIGPVRMNLSKRGIGISTGVKGFRVGTGPRGPYVAGGRGGIYFRQRLGGRSRRTSTPIHTGYALPGSTTPHAAGSMPDPNMPSPVDNPPARRLYPGWLLGVLSAACAVSLVLILSDPSLYHSSQMGALGNLGIGLGLLLITVVCALDWRGATSLNGVVKWRRMTAGQGCLVGFLLLGFSPFLLPVYLVQAITTYRKAKEQEPLERQRAVAQLEADLGMVPATDGVCRNCGKPLQVGADYCAYCAAPVLEKPTVCPVCATTALPDARYCPKCRAPLRTEP